MISVIIPTYNRADRLIRSVESVRKQSIKDLEIIIVDDGSTDTTKNVVKSINDKRIKYYRHKTNRGACAARNTGIMYAKGEYIAFQDSDDVWHENKIEVELKALLNNNADIVFCKMNLINGDKLMGVGPDSFSEGFIKTEDDVYGIGTQTLFGKSYIFKSLYFDNKLLRYQDLDLMIRIFDLGYRVYFCDQILLDYCFDPGINSISGNPHRLESACKRLLQKYPQLLSLHKKSCCIISEYIFHEAFRKELSINEKNQLLTLSVTFNPGIRTISRYLMVKTKIYSLLKRFIYQHSS